MENETYESQPSFSLILRLSTETPGRHYSADELRMQPEPRSETVYFEKGDKYGRLIEPFLEEAATRLGVKKEDLRVSNGKKHLNLDDECSSGAILVVEPPLRIRQEMIHCQPSIINVRERRIRHRKRKNHYEGLA